MAQIGYYALVLALCMSLYGVGAYIFGLKQDRQDFISSAVGAVMGSALFATVATAVMVYLLMSSDFSVEYVAMYTSTDLPTFYKFSALWAGGNGSLLLWAWLLTMFTAIVIRGKAYRELAPYVGAVMSAIAVFFLFLLCYNSNPFAVLPVTPPEGNGMNPMLQNPGMVIHPLTLFIGYVGFTVPFAFAIAALIKKKTDDMWIRATRHWTVISWLFLSLGNLFGAQWAYVELGWGGYWAWDPVENASLMPWLTGSAFLHSVMVQERKNMLKIWSVLLIIITFSLTLFGTFLVRSGIVSSVHAFGSSSIGTFFLAFMTLVITASLYLVADRLKMLKQSNEFEGIISKESSFLLNNLLLVGSAFTIFWGTIFPVVSELFTGNKVTVGPPFFNAVIAPLGLAFVLLMGICPLIAWRRASLKNLISNFIVPIAVAIVAAGVLFATGVTKVYALIAYSISVFVVAATLQDILKGIWVRKKLTGESLFVSTFRLLTKNRRRYGGYIIHIGIVMMIVGITGSNVYNTELTKTVKPGEAIEFAGYKMTYNGLQENARKNTQIVFADTQLSKDGQFLRSLHVEKVFYPTSEQPSTEPAIYSTWVEDFYVTLAGWEQDQSASFKINLNPLVKWLWVGGYVLILGTMFALWPGKGSGVGTKYLGRS